MVVVYGSRGRRQMMYLRGCCLLGVAKSAEGRQGVAEGQK